MTTVLVVDDEPQLRRALDVNLRIRGYDVLLAATGREALERAATGRPDLVILDLGLPDVDGIEVVRGLRGWTKLPIIILSAREREHDKVEALDAGADDYVTKPFGIAELLARVRANVRRVPEDRPIDPVVETSAFTIDLAAKRATRADDPVHLTPIEWSIVETLLRAPDRLFTHQQLIRSVWGTTVGIDANLLRVHMANLRRKLEPDTAQPRYFRTEPGMGYRFVPEEATSQTS
jgi:two-component system, OmpR family, KDP operon response regulator KdpE